MNIMNISGGMAINPYRSYGRTSNMEQTKKLSFSMDKVEISSDAIELYSEKQDIRTDKVEELKSRIESGNYYISTADIVSGMMRPI